MLSIALPKAPLKYFERELFRAARHNEQQKKHHLNTPLDLDEELLASERAAILAAKLNSDSSRQNAEFALGPAHALNRIGDALT